MTTSPGMMGSSFIVSWHNTWAWCVRMLKMCFSGRLKCVLSTLAYLGWCRTTYLFPVCQIYISVCYTPHFLVATCTNAECVFSEGWLVLLHICNQLSATSTHTLMCLGAWSKLGLVHDADIRAAAILPDIVCRRTKQDEVWLGLYDIWLDLTMLSIIQFVARLVLYLNIVLDPCIHPLWVSDPQNPVETLTPTFQIPLPKGYMYVGVRVNIDVKTPTGYAYH